MSVSGNMVNGVVYGYWPAGESSIDELEAQVTEIRGVAAEMNGHCVSGGLPARIEGTHRRVGPGRASA